MSDFWKAPVGVAVVIGLHMATGIIAQLSGLIFVAIPLLLLFAAVHYFFS